MTANRSLIENLVMRMQGDFLEKPGQALRLADAEKRFGLDPVTCEAILGALVDSNVLARTPDGAFIQRVSRFTKYAA